MAFLFDHLMVALNEDIHKLAETEFSDGSKAADDPVLYRAASNLLSSLPKKFVGDSETYGAEHTDASRERSAYDRFVKRIDEGKLFNERFSSASGRAAQFGKWDSLMGDARALFELWLQELDERLSNPLEVAQVGQTGPGATVDSASNDAYTKLFNGPVTIPSELCLGYFYCLLHANPTHKCAELVRAAREKTGFYLEDRKKVAVRESDFLATVRRLEASSELTWHITPATWSTVPKSQETHRSTVTPTTIGGFIQRGIGILLEDVLAQHGLDLANQPDRNRVLALIGSLGEEGVSSSMLKLTSNRKLLVPATIDLTDASDCIWYSLVEWFCQNLPHLWRAMKASRDSSVAMQLQTCPEQSKEYFTLSMFSTMGNGFTFPLQTLIFTSIVRAALKAMNLPDRVDYMLDGRQVRLRCWGVFGDDIVLPSVVFDVVMCVLRDACGMHPNMEKSFSSGEFRESCGSDWFAGINVRGVYCKDLRYPVQRVRLLNRLLEWSSAWGIPLNGTIQVLMSAIPRRYQNFVPPWEDVSAGIRVTRQWLLAKGEKAGGVCHPSSLSQNFRRLIGAVNTGDWAYLPYRPIPDTLDLATKRWLKGPETSDDVMGTKVWFQVRPTAASQVASGVRPKWKEFHVANPFGFTLLAAEGRVLGPSVGVRSYTPLYSQRHWCCVFHWDHAPALLPSTLGCVDSQEGWFRITDWKSGATMPSLCQPVYPTDWSSRVDNLTRCLLASPLLARW